MCTKFGLGPHQKREGNKNGKAGGEGWREGAERGLGRRGKEERGG